MQCLICLLISDTCIHVFVDLEMPRRPHHSPTCSHAVIVHCSIAHVTRVHPLSGTCLPSRTMRAMSITMLTHGISLGLAFAPPCVPPAGSAVPTPRKNGMVRPRDTCSRQRLFNPDQADEIVASPKAGTKAGGWGAWTKETSQREEQEKVLKRFCQEDNRIASGLRVRTGQKADMLTISHLCVDTFRGPFEWWMLPVQLFQEFSFFGQINGRLGRVTRNDIQHSMVVVEDIRSRKVVGFLEIGMLPKPTSSEESALAGAAITAAMVAATAPDKGEGLSPEGSDAGPSETGRNDDGSGNEDGGDTSVAFERAPDVAFLANVVVDKNQRRRGIGRTMVYSAIEVIRELWPAEKRIYVTVEQGNEIAVALYTGMGFEMTALEDEMMARVRKRPARIYLSKSLA